MDRESKVLIGVTILAFILVFTILLKPTHVVVKSKENQKIINKLETQRDYYNSLQSNPTLVEYSFSKQREISHKIDSLKNLN